MAYNASFPPHPLWEFIRALDPQVPQAPQAPQAQAQAQGTQPQGPAEGNPSAQSSRTATPGQAQPQPEQPFAAPFDPFFAFGHEAGGPWGRRGGRGGGRRGGRCGPHGRCPPGTEQEGCPAFVSASENRAGDAAGEAGEQNEDNTGRPEGPDGGNPWAYAYAGHGGRGGRHGHGHPHGHHGSHGRGHPFAAGFPFAAFGVPAEAPQGEQEGQEQEQARPRGPAQPFDIQALIGTFAHHPLAQAIRTFIETQNQQTEKADTAESFTPPMDVFSTPTSYELHVSLPGAKKEDVGVNWDAEKSELSIAGVIYRPGDEAFIAGLKKGERKIGVFERTVKLPLLNEKEEIDPEQIAAKLEDGVLVVRVGKVEKEIKEVKRVEVN